MFEYISSNTNNTLAYVLVLAFLSICSSALFHETVLFAVLL